MEIKNATSKNDVWLACLHEIRWFSITRSYPLIFLTMLVNIDCVFERKYVLRQRLEQDFSTPCTAMKINITCIKMKFEYVYNF